MSTLACIVERLPSGPDSILDLSCLPLLECNHLSKIFGAFFRSQYLNFDVVDRHFSSVRALVAETFRLFWLVF